GRRRALRRQSAGLRAGPGEPAGLARGRRVVRLFPRPGPGKRLPPGGPRPRPARRRRHLGGGGDAAAWQWGRRSGHARLQRGPAPGPGRQLPPLGPRPAAGCGPALCPGAARAGARGRGRSRSRVGRRSAALSRSAPGTAWARFDKPAPMGDNPRPPAVSVMSPVPASYAASARLSVAPMMDWTDRHCRVFHRLLAPHARLYTEMVHANAVVLGDRARLLGFDPVEHPLALQLGGSEPEALAQATRIGVEWGYDEVNLNCGCPSDRVQAGRFG